LDGGPVVDTSSFPGFDHIYWIHQGFEQDTTYGILDQEIPVNFGQIIRGTVSPAIPIHIKLHELSKISDIIWIASDTMAVTDDVISVFTKYNIVGWTTYPLLSEPQNDSNAKKYHGLAITGRCGAINYSRSVPIQRRYPAGVFPAFQGIYFDESSWDGSDIFMTPPESIWTFVTERVRSALQECAINNVILERVTDIILDAWIVENHRRDKL
jgi:hypothetical protein